MANEILQVLMGKISNVTLYPNDSTFVGDETLIGTDSDGQTRTYLLSDLDTYFGSSALSASDVKTLYESNVNTNAFTDAEKTKLAGLSATTAFTADVNVEDGIKLRFGTASGEDADVYTDGNDLYIDLLSAGAGDGNLYIRNDSTTILSLMRDSGVLTVEGQIVTDGNTIQVKGASPRIQFQETDELNKTWYVLIDGGLFSIRETNTASTRFRIEAGNDFSFLGGGILIDDANNNAWGLRTDTNDANFSGIYFDPNGNAQLVARDLSGNLDVFLNTAGESTFANTVAFNGGLTGTTGAFTGAVSGASFSGVGTSLTALVAANVNVADSGANYTATDLEGILAEIAPQLGAGGGGTGNAVIEGVTGTQDGSNTSFTVASSSYTAGSLIVIINGQALQDGAGLTENTPGGGTFTLDYAPLASDSILSIHT